MEQLIYKKMPPATRYFERNLEDYFHFCHSLRKMTDDLFYGKNPAFLCIGTDCMTGDCLGPLVGHKLEKHFSGSVPVFGTLKHPIHALNLQNAMSQIPDRAQDSFVIVIDAALGLPDHIGSVTLSPGALSPGEGMRKKLPAVGDLAITGIVNSCHGNASLLLQNTRLHLVNELADFIFTGLISCFS